MGELKRLMPHILPNAKALDSIPQMVKVVEDSSKVAADSLVQAAYGYQLELQKAANMDVEDTKANFFVASAIKDWVNQDNDRRVRFWRGDRTVIKEGFDEVKKVLIDPIRKSNKQDIGATIRHRPNNAAPAGSPGAGSEGGPKALDFRDPKAVRAAFKAALATPA